MPADDSDPAARFERTYGCTLEQAVDWLLRAALRLTRGDCYAAEDLAQSTMERLLTATPRTVPSSAYKYIMRALTNRFLDDRRHNGAIRRGGDNPAPPLHEAQEPAAPGPRPEESVIIQETREAVLDAIQKLPEPERMIVELALNYLSLGLDFRSREEIAEELGIPVGTVKSRLHCAIRHLRTLIPRPAEGGNE